MIQERHGRSAKYTTKNQPENMEGTADLEGLGVYEGNTETCRKNKLRCGLDSPGPAQGPQQALQ